MKQRDSICMCFLHLSQNLLKSQQLLIRYLVLDYDCYKALEFRKIGSESQENSHSTSKNNLKKISSKPFTEDSKPPLRKSSTGTRGRDFCLFLAEATLEPVKAINILLFPPSFCFIGFWRGVERGRREGGRRGDIGLLFNLIDAFIGFFLHVP